MHLVLLVLYAILNCVRGRGWLPKVPCYMLFGVLACATAYVCGLSGDWLFWLELWVLAFGGSWFGFMWCWGKYFPDLSPTYDQTCVPLVDKVTTAIYGPYTATTPDPQVLNWKTIAMSWRWIIFFSLKYALLGMFHVYYGADSSAMIVAFIECLLLLALVGLIYRFSLTKFPSKGVSVAELITGFCVIGVADWVILG